MLICRCEGTGIFFNEFKVTHRSFVKLDTDPQKKTMWIHSPGDT